MMSNKNIILILMSLLILGGCLGASPNKRKVKSTSDSSTTDNPTDPNFSTQSLYWFTTQNVTGTLNVNAKSDNVVYLRGSYAHTFLISNNINGIQNYKTTNKFCAVFDFGGSYKPLRVRAVPLSINNYTTKTLERLFRIDLPSAEENFATCNVGTINGIAPTKIATAYSLSEICPTCTSVQSLTTTNVELYEINPSDATNAKISNATLPANSLAMRVDLTSTSTGDQVGCSNSSCSAKGFDCCIEGQCVKDGTIKSSVSSSSPGYDQALNDFAQNPLSFINYPTIFNVCSNITHEPPVTGGGNDNSNQNDAKDRIAKYLTDFKCVAKAEEGSFNYSLCLPNNNEASYITTKAKLAVACGCPSSYDQAEREIKCPNWGVRPVYNSSIEIDSNIVDFYCYTPPPTNQIGDITNLNVTVSSRSAPHRFFSTQGDLYDDPTKANSSVVQEGEDFNYLDNVHKSNPENGLFNINSILGRMNIGLSQTAPAKQLTVEIGQTYIISTTSGYFTPCSTCAKDSWYNNLTAHPQTVGGVGLIAKGYSTARDEFRANSSFGNYEDTKFGRACYVPVTMLPFSHQKFSDLKAQRQNRLKTQAAFYINGYQRDWYGFNKGAMIGSFDGVKWFAIGNGRRMTASSSKLYLAINGAYLDLADRTDHVVNIIPDLSANTASSFDFDPTLAINDKAQNQAGSCQQFHQCNADADCVTQLGWEYTCADISQLKTNWPTFDNAGNELFNQESPNLLVEILGTNINLGASNKRCVYRGAGAPCVRNITNLTDANTQKNLTCAPNFYCASLETSRFNSELARSPNEFDAILYGMDANVLGRPLNYATARASLPSEVKNNLYYNTTGKGLGLPAISQTDFGICRPGKALVTTLSTTSDLTGHMNEDPNKRSDFISQISSCNPDAATGPLRTVQCPAFDENLNYKTLTATAPDNAELVLSKYMQNMCGKESQSATRSAFANIEALSLILNRDISRPTLAADACLRRAGSVCHTDLDCGPNKLHAEEASTLGLSYFGGTVAEQNYWKEYLVCSQATPVPANNSAKYFDYKLSENRCCREIGKDFTMYTQGPKSVIPENSGTNENLETARFSSDNPKANNRYSRYIASKTAVHSSTKFEVPNVSATQDPRENQWKVINETGNQTCCGGGWIRKFADGTHNWNIKNRLQVDVSNFSCLNYRSLLVNSSYNNFAADLISQASYRKDSAYYCHFLGENGCMQVPFQESTEYDVLPPFAYDPAAATSIWGDAPVASGSSAAYDKYPQTQFTRLDTSPTADPYVGGEYSWRLNTDIPFMPQAHLFTQWPFDQNAYADQATKQTDIYFLDIDLDYGVSFYLPSYVQYNSAASGAAMNTRIPSVRKIYIKYYYDGSSVPFVEDITSMAVNNDTLCSGVTTYNPPGHNGQPIDNLGLGVNPAGWCVTQQTETGNRPIMHVKANRDPVRTKWKYAGIVIEFKPLELRQNKTITVPGNIYYYLEKLGRLELLGIPQITYEPLYCNNDQSKVVPGLFKSNLQTRTQFQTTANTYTNRSYNDHGVAVGMGNSEAKFTYQNNIDHTQIFSSNEFSCCTPVGRETTDGAKCCSGFAKKDGTVSTCALPQGTDLHVYFNKFVSSEGVGTDLPGGGLVVNSTNPDEVDFDAFTGEPKMREVTFQKILELGKAYCASGVVANGGSFGQFAPEPNNGSWGYYNSAGSSSSLSYPISIVDSIFDTIEGAGKSTFDAGQRWDHHYYCK